MKLLHKNMENAARYALIVLGILLFMRAMLFACDNKGFYLSFSDTAKNALIAKQLYNHGTFKSPFDFYSIKLFANELSETVYTGGVSPVTPLVLYLNFLLLGVSDSTVITTSFFFFLLSLIFTYLLGKKILRSSFAGILLALAVGFNYDILTYATNGASESIFIFEIIATSYFLSLRKKWAAGLGFVLMILMYFTRPQAFIYIAGLVLFYLLLRFKTKQAVLYFAGVLIVGLLVDRLVLIPLSGRYYIYSITQRGQNIAKQYLPGIAVSDALRGNIVPPNSFPMIFKKVFYNLYNFYKLLPQIVSPYLWTLFVIGLFRGNAKRGHVLKGNVENSLKLAVVFMVAVTLLVTALTIPFFRYLHPVVPLVYLYAMATLVWIVQEIVNSQWAMIRRWPIVRCFRKKVLVAIISSFLVLFFVVGQTLGAMFLDSRFKADRTNMDKPPVYVELSWKLKEVTDSDDTIITNLDTWGSWYGERRTVWFPLEPNQLISPKGQENPFDAIYLTSYLMDDENYYMGDEWRQIFYNPENPENEYIAENYELKEIIEIDSEDVYEKQDARAVLLVKKRNTD